MNTDNILITIPHTKGQTLPLNGGFNIELQGCILKHINQITNQLQGMDYCIDFFQLIDTGWCSENDFKDIEQMIESGLIAFDIVGIFILADEGGEPYVMIITNETLGLKLTDHLKNYHKMV